MTTDDPPLGETLPEPMVLVWIGALLIGLSLGLLGSGGSILTVPTLVYLVGEPEKVAIAESLGIVGLISLVGAVPYAVRRNIHWRSVLFFGVPGMAGTYLGAYLSKFLPGVAQLALFALVMLVAAGMMLRPAPAGQGPTRRSFVKIALEGGGVGVLTGLVGVGGGFLIIPALVLLGGLSMHLAIGTSLLIIAMKSLSGFYKYVDVLSDAGLGVDWKLVLLFSGIGIAGSFLGGRIGESVPPGVLKKGFALFLVLMGVFILYQNLPAVLG